MIKEKSQTWASISKKLGYVFSHLPFPPDYYTWLTIPVALERCQGPDSLTQGFSMYLFCFFCQRAACGGFRKKKRAKWAGATAPAHFARFFWGGVGSSDIGMKLSREGFSARPFSCRLRRQKWKKEVFGDTPNPGRASPAPLTSCL